MGCAEFAVTAVWKVYVVCGLCYHQRQLDSHEYVMMWAERAGVQPISVLYGTTGSYMFGLGVTTNERNNIAALVAVKSELKSLNRKNELTKNGN